MAFISSGPLWPAILEPHLHNIEQHLTHELGPIRCRHCTITIGDGPVLQAAIVTGDKDHELVRRLTAVELAAALAGADLADVPIEVTVNP